MGRRPFLRTLPSLRVIPILLSGSPLGSANMHSKRTFRQVCCPLNRRLASTQMRYEKL